MCGWVKVSVMVNCRCQLAHPQVTWEEAMSVRDGLLNW